MVCPFRNSPLFILHLDPTAKRKKPRLTPSALTPLLSPLSLSEDLREGQKTKERKNGRRRERRRADGRGGVRRDLAGAGDRVEAHPTWHADSVHGRPSHHRHCPGIPRSNCHPLFLIFLILFYFLKKENSVRLKFVSCFSSSFSAMNSGYFICSF